MDGEAEEEAGIQNSNTLESRQALSRAQLQLIIHAISCVLPVDTSQEIPNGRRPHHSS